MDKLITDYEQSLDNLYEHLGFKEDWVVYPIDIRTEYYWKIVGDDPLHQAVVYGETQKKVIEETGSHYCDDIYPQRFYEKWVYRGSKFTMIFAHPHVDGMKYFAIFDNEKEIKDSFNFGVLQPLVDALGENNMKIMVDEKYLIQCGDCKNKYLTTDEEIEIGYCFDCYQSRLTDL